LDGHAALQKADPFGRAALPRDHRQPLTATLQRAACFLLDVEPELHRKANTAQNTECILFKSLGRLTHATQHPGSQILLTAVKVDQLRILADHNRQRRIAAKILLRGGGYAAGHGVDGKIAAAKIVRDAIGKLYGVGMATIGVGALDAVGGAFDRLTVDQHRDRPVLQPGLDGAQARRGKYFQHRIGRRRRRDVKIVRRNTAQCVAQATAHQICGIPRSLQGMQHQEQLWGKIYRQKAC
jgi:hypothetical protein